MNFSIIFAKGIVLSMWLSGNFHGSIQLSCKILRVFTSESFGTSRSVRSMLSGVCCFIKCAFSFFAFLPVVWILNLDFFAIVPYVLGTFGGRIWASVLASRILGVNKNFIARWHYLVSILNVNLWIWGFAGILIGPLNFIQLLMHRHCFVVSLHFYIWICKLIYFIFNLFLNFKFSYSCQNIS